MELDLGNVALDGSLHKAPYGGRTRPVAANEAGCGLSLPKATGVPIGWASDGAKRNEVKMLSSTLEMQGVDVVEQTAGERRGNDYPSVRRELAALGLVDLDIQRRGASLPGVKSSR